MIPQSRIHFSRAQVLAKSFFEYVTHADGYVILWQGLKLSTWCAGSGASWDMQIRVSHHLCSAQATRHQLHRDLQMAATCARLGGSQ